MKIGRKFFSCRFFLSKKKIKDVIPLFLVKNARKVKIKRTIIVNNDLILYFSIKKVSNIALQA
jgi:hypothetical protein